MASDCATDRIPPQMTAPLRHELVRQVDKSFMKFPWEKGRLAKVLGKDATIGTSVTGVRLADRNPIKLDFVRSDDQRTSVAMSERYEAPSSCLFTMFVRDQQSRAVNIYRESRRDAAVDKWVGILKDDYEHSLPGRQALNESLPSKRETYLKSVVNATFLLKSPGTLLKRYYAIRAFVFWMHDRHSRPWLPMLEIDAWSYVRSLAKDGAAATKGNSFLEAARFCHFVAHLWCSGIGPHVDLSAIIFGRTSVIVNTVVQGAFIFGFRFHFRR